MQSLVQLLIERHFLDLLEKRFIFQFAAQGKEELEFGMSLISGVSGPSGERVRIVVPAILLVSHESEIATE
jgi:hypothetical protein